MSTLILLAILAGPPVHCVDAFGNPVPCGSGASVSRSDSSFFSEFSNAKPFQWADALVATEHKGPGSQARNTSGSSKDGSGTVIGGRREGDRDYAYVMSCAHTLGGPNYKQLIIEGNAWMSSHGEIVATDSGLDISLLRFPFNPKLVTIHVLPVARSNPAIGTCVTGIGISGGAPYAVAGPISFYQGDMLYFKGVAKEGMSGGMIHNKESLVAVLNESIGEGETLTHTGGPGPKAIADWLESVGHGWLVGRSSVERPQNVVQSPLVPVDEVNPPPLPLPSQENAREESSPISDRLSHQQEQEPEPNAKIEAIKKVGVYSIPYLVGLAGGSGLAGVLGMWALQAGFNAIDRRRKRKRQSYKRTPSAAPSPRAPQQTPLPQSQPPSPQQPSPQPPSPEPAEQPDEKIPFTLGWSEQPRETTRNRFVRVTETDQLGEAYKESIASFAESNPKWAGGLSLVEQLAQQIYKGKKTRSRMNPSAVDNPLIVPEPHYHQEST